MKSYSVVKHNAIRFATERNQAVYIAKAKRQNHFRIYFSESERTPNYEIIESVMPDQTEGGK